LSHSNRVVGVSGFTLLRGKAMSKWDKSRRRLGVEPGTRFVPFSAVSAIPLRRGGNGPAWSFPASRKAAARPWDFRKHNTHRTEAIFRLSSVTNPAQSSTPHAQIDYSCFCRGGELPYADLIQYGGGSVEGWFGSSEAKPEGT